MSNLTSPPTAKNPGAGVAECRGSEPAHPAPPARDRPAIQKKSRRLPFEEPPAAVAASIALSLTAKHTQSYRATLPWEKHLRSACSRQTASWEIISLQPPCMPVPVHSSL